MIFERLIESFLRLVFITFYTVG